jgi:hypothetical protein
MRAFYTMYVLLILATLAGGVPYTLSGSYDSYDLCEAARRAARDDLAKSGAAIEQQSCKKKPQ